MRLLADKYIYKLEDFLPTDVELVTYDPLEGSPHDLDGFDALLVRTVTKINPETYPEFPDSLKFIGTASSGSDHLDIDYIQSKGIQTGDSKGCNANAVAEYVITSMIYWADRNQESLRNISVGIIGFGFIGSLVAKKLDELGIEHVDYDPPLDEWDESFTTSSLLEVLSCDVLTLHIPLIKEGDEPTYHWLDHFKMSQSPFRLIINASRGGIIEEDALIELFDSNHILDYVKDVWENEPHYNYEVLKRALIATPHIAGYSVEAKLMATRMIVDKMCDHFGLKENQPNIEIAKADYSHIRGVNLTDVLLQINPILKYDSNIKSLSNDDKRGREFAKIRSTTKYRNEFNHIILEDTVLEDFPVLKKLGFLSKSSGK